MLSFHVKFVQTDRQTDGHTGFGTFGDAESCFGNAEIDFGIAEMCIYA